MHGHVEFESLSHFITGGSGSASRLPSSALLSMRWLVFWMLDETHLKNWCSESGFASDILITSLVISLSVSVLTLGPQPSATSEPILLMVRLLSLFTGSFHKSVGAPSVNRNMSGR